MNTEPLKKKEGFTLIEVLLAVFISLVLLTSVYFAVTSAQRSTTGVDIKVAAQQDVRAILDVMALEIGMASYNPTYSLAVWEDWQRGIRETPNPPPSSTNLSMAYGLRVSMDLAGTGITSNLARITYAYDAGDQRITRDNWDGSGPQPFLGDALGSPRSVRVVNEVNGNGVYDAGTDLPVFRYFDTTGVEIPIADLPGRIPEIRRIEITLAVETEDLDPNTKQRRRMIYTTSVIPRNHGIF
jgi:prepilin-type N-terminal cleavage/methylation domain-containing protein